MALVECKRGPTSTQVGGNTYTFDLDRAGRAVASVSNFKHQQILVSSGVYQVVDPLPAPAPEPASVPDDQTDQTEQDNAVADAGNDTGGSSDDGEAPAGQNDANAGPGDTGLSEADEATDTGASASEAGEGEAGPADDLSLISGIGATTAARLNERGITTFKQIAALTAEQIAELDEALNLKGGITRNEWANQANILIAKAQRNAG